MINIENSPNPTRMEIQKPLLFSHKIFTDETVEMFVANLVTTRDSLITYQDGLDVTDANAIWLEHIMGYDSSDLDTKTKCFDSIDIPSPKALGRSAKNKI